MRVIHFERSSATGHVVPRCGVWGSMDTGWTAVADGVTCVACRGAMSDDVRDGVRVDEAATQGS